MSNTLTFKCFTYLKQHFVYFLVEEEAHEEVEAQKEEDEGKVWSMITIIEL